MRIELEYVNIKEPTFNCKDMDARLRGILVGQMGKQTNYNFSWKAKAALIKRAKEITAGTIELLVKSIPSTFTIIDCIWHEFPDAIMDRLVNSDYWESEDCSGHIPEFMKDFILLHGEKLLEKYEKNNMILANVLCRREDAGFGTPGYEDHNSKQSAMPKPETYIKYYKRYRGMPNRWRDVNNYDTNFMLRVGDYIMKRKLDIVIHESKGGADESRDRAAEAGSDNSRGEEARI